jgi:hypothetical protein
MVPRDRIELPTRGFSVPLNLFSLDVTKPHQMHIKALQSLYIFAIVSSLEVTRQHTASRLKWGTDGGLG